MKQVVVFHDAEGRRRTMEVEDTPAAVAIPILMRGGFGQRVYYLTGARDEKGRLVYGDPQ